MVEPRSLETLQTQCPGARIILEVNCTGCHRPCLRNGWTLNSHSLHCNCRLVVIVKNCFFCNMALTSSEQSCQLSSASADRAGLSIAEKADQRQSESEWGRTTRVWTERTTRWKAREGFINPNPLDLLISTIFFEEISFEECKWYSFVYIDILQQHQCSSGGAKEVQIEENSSMPTLHMLRGCLKGVWVGVNFITLLWNSSIPHTPLT